MHPFLCLKVALQVAVLQNDDLKPLHVHSGPGGHARTAINIGMKLKRVALLLLLLGFLGVPARGQTGIFTVQIGTPSSPPVTLVSHSNSWRYRYGSTAPSSGWQTNADGSLDGTWLTGTGGFGFSNDWAPETNRCPTGVGSMFNGPTTLYIRQTFEVTNSGPPLQGLSLVVDFDDGFVAYLDGAEIGRFNAPGSVGVEPAYTAIATASHESRDGNPNNSPQPPMTLSITNQLTSGTHVLSLLGLNRASNSTDFILIADLNLPGTGGGGPDVDGYFRLVTNNVIELTGSNTIPNSARVQVNGIDAVYNIANGTWSKPQPLAPGMNHLFITALDSSGAILASLTKDVVAEVSSTTVGGILASNTTWTSSMGIIRLSSDVIVPAGLTLSILDGVVVLLPLTNSIKAQAGGAVTVNALESNQTWFLPADGTNAWQELSATGTNASLTLRQAAVVAGQVRALNAGAVLVEDSVLRDLIAGAREIVAGVNGSQVTLRRSYIARFNEVDARETPVLIEDCLLERFFTDGVDIKATNNAPLVVRRSTLRFGDPGNSNADAVDFGPGAGTVERCLIHDFPDKGISIGGAPGTSVRDSLIYKCGIGVSAYSSSDVVLVNNTVANCANGIFFRNNPTPAIGTATNLIVWDNVKNVVLSNATTLELSYSDIQGTNFPGAGNISAEPLFVNPAASDYRLADGSPAIHTGLNGVDMGALYPLGGIPSAPFDLAVLSAGPGQVQLRWKEEADNEAGFWVQSAPDGIQWEDEVQPGPNITSVTFPLSPNRRYLRIKAYNSAGESAWSNIAIAPTPGTAVSETFVGGTLTNHTTWTTNMGMIIVRSNVIVPSNIGLTILEGTVIKLTNNASIRAVGGGAINILGTSSNKVSLSSWNEPNLWAELSAQFGGSLTIRHADIAGGQVTVYSNAVGLVEDSYIHHYRLLSGGTIFTSPILLTHFAGPVTVRRCHFQEYYETLLRHTLILVEDCLFEDIHGDGLDFDAALAGTILRRSTFRNGVSGNVDAIDVGNDGTQGCTNILIESCLMYNFPFDKGVSIGDLNTSHGVIVSNCLIYGCNAGVAVKDECEAAIYQCTIVECGAGFTNYYKPNISSPTGGGRTTNSYNNILWDNQQTIVVLNDGLLVADHSDLGHTNWPGMGNIDLDPLFLNPTERDYRLATNSLCRGTGRDGSDMGVVFPVGGVPDVPLNLRVTAVGVSLSQTDLYFVNLEWQDNSWNESGFVIERSTDGTLWSFATNVSMNATNTIVSGFMAGQNYLLRMRATNFIGDSFNSNIASTYGNPDDRDGDGMPNDWEVMHLFDPDDASDAAEDADMDGATNLQEYLAGTDPRNAASLLRLELVSFTSPGQVELRFIAVSNKSYTIEFRQSWSSGMWGTLIDVPADSSTRPFTVIDSVPPGTTTRFYRVSAAP
jgi:hypothetical protein